MLWFTIGMLFINLYTFRSFFKNSKLMKLYLYHPRFFNVLRLRVFHKKRELSIKNVCSIKNVTLCVISKCDKTLLADKKSSLIVLRMEFETAKLQYVSCGMKKFQT